jgi:hypothetical protein
MSETDELYKRTDKLYEELKKRIDKLRQHFLKERAELENPTDSPLLDEDLDLHAYSLMAHASFENYFEDVARLILEASVERWEKAGKSSVVLLCLLRHFDPGATRRAKDKCVQDYLKGQIGIVRKEHDRIIRQNHGISSKNIHSLFGPLGIDSYVDNVSLGSLDTFSSKRGDIAHTYGAITDFGIQEVKTWIDDALKIAEALRDEVKEMLKPDS